MHRIMAMAHVAFRPQFRPRRIPHKLPSAGMNFEKLFLSSPYINEGIPEETTEGGLVGEYPTKPKSDPTPKEPGNFKRFKKRFRGFGCFDLSVSHGNKKAANPRVAGSSPGRAQ